MATRDDVTALGVTPVMPYLVYESKGSIEFHQHSKMFHRPLVFFPLQLEKNIDQTPKQSLHSRSWLQNYTPLRFWCEQYSQGTDFKSGQQQTGQR